ncbi:Cthe_2314 family HEPN domain-containing protein [Limibacterium fermenti]|jgi:hypothetical protein|uniref:Cthe_2314 family HEPN domain-containing protein n=1 Tax=Limibacterium fermenti TaxID=3229863 RepID=UPI000E7D369A|nr:hypothetical protein [Porphyromonadaceae bacterium]
MLTDRNNGPKTVDELEKTVFWKLIVKDYSPVVTKNEKSEEEDFYYEVFVKSYNIIGTLRTLELIVELLKELTQEDMGINSRKITLIRYHVENFYSRITKVNDQILLLINVIFSLELQEKECYYRTVSNKLKKISETENILDYLTSNSEAFEVIRDERNKITHRENFLDLDFANLSASAFLGKATSGELNEYLGAKITIFEKYIVMVINWAFWAGVLLMKPYNNRKGLLKKEI